MIGPVIKYSFNTLLRLHEVMHVSELVAMFADTWIEIHTLKGQAGFRHGTTRSVALAGRRALG